MPWTCAELDTATQDDIGRCRAHLRGGSRTFYAASFLLPQSVREPATALYAFCRLADDAIDTGGGLAALAELGACLDRVYEQRPRPHPIERALAAVVARYALPRALLEALLEGMSWDVTGHRYDTLSDVYAYGARVAGTVGAMMAVLMGARTPALLARATELGLAMQLSNIARDVGEDARNGRLYLPRAWLDEHGIDAEAFLRRPRHTPALATVVARLLAAAETLYERADTGIRGLPAGCRFGIRAARLLYAEIGNEVARRGYDGVSARAVVSPRRKAALLLHAAVGQLAPAGPGDYTMLPETRFLVEAAARSANPSLTGPRAGLISVIDLFERLERRDRVTRYGVTG